MSSLLQRPWAQRPLPEKGTSGWPESTLGRQIYQQREMELLLGEWPPTAPLRQPRPASPQPRRLPRRLLLRTLPQNPQMCLTPYELLCRQSTIEPQRFNLEPIPSNARTKHLDQISIRRALLFQHFGNVGCRTLLRGGAPEHIKADVNGACSETALAIAQVIVPHSLELFSQAHGLNGFARSGEAPPPF